MGLSGERLRELGVVLVAIHEDRIVFT